MFKIALPSLDGFGEPGASRAGGEERGSGAWSEKPRGSARGFPVVVWMAER